VPTGPTPELRARNAAGKQARSAPKVEHRPPRRVNTEAEEAAAFERHHRALLEDEAARHAMVEAAADAQRALEHEEEDQRVRGIDLDEDRKRRGRPQRDPEDGRGEDGEAAAQAAQAAASKGLAQADGAGRYFQDAPADRLGDPSLTRPDDIKRQLGPSVRFAQHAMILAEARLKASGRRDEAVSFLASLYLGVSDRAYANKALREFGPATGIIDIYPLEVMQHLLQHVPGFVSRANETRFLEAKTATYRARAGEPIRLVHDPELRIRGFALPGGARPGYVLEPVDPPGTYHLTFLEAGQFDVLLSAISREGWLLIETLRCEIAPGDPAILARLEGEERVRGAVEEDAGAEPPAEPRRGGRDDLTFHFPRRI
jgi:hypothetical protein